MRRSILILALFSSFSLLSFTEKGNPSAKHAPVKALKNKKPAFYSSAWESVAEWSAGEPAEQKNFFFNRRMPELTDAELKEGAVMVFVKGYDFDGFSKSSEKPLCLPFYLMSPDEDSPYTYSWSCETSNGNIKLSLDMHPKLENTFVTGREKIRVRYFVLPKSFLEQKNCTAQSLRGKNYKQFAEMLGVSE